MCESGSAEDSSAQNFMTPHYLHMSLGFKFLSTIHARIFQATKLYELVNILIYVLYRFIQNLYV